MGQVRAARPPRDHDDVTSWWPWPRRCHIVVAAPGARSGAGTGRAGPAGRTVRTVRGGCHGARRMRTVRGERGVDGEGTGVDRLPGTLPSSIRMPFRPAGVWRWCAGPGRPACRSGHRACPAGTGGGQHEPSPRRDLPDRVLERGAGPWWHSAGTIRPYPMSCGCAGRRVRHRRSRAVRTRKCPRRWVIRRRAWRRPGAERAAGYGVRCAWPPDGSAARVVPERGVVRPPRRGRSRGRTQ